MGTEIASLRWSKLNKRVELWVATDLREDGGSYKKIAQFDLSNLLSLLSKS